MKIEGAAARRMPGGEVIKCTLSSSCKRSATRGSIVWSSIKRLGILLNATWQDGTLLFRQRRPSPAHAEGNQCFVLAPGSRRVKICLWQVKQSRCHSGLDPESRRRPGESREPVYSNITGCRIKPGMTFKERIKIDIFIQST